MSDTYYSIAADAQAQVTEKRSRFLAYAYAVTAATQVKEHVDALRKQYFDARHVCYAYMLGADRLTFRANDDGEPSGTAGKPILGQINSLGLTDVLVVVVRYFGGVKLGTPGLIAAYREAARAVLVEAGTKECRQCAGLTFTFPYMAIDKVMRLAKTDPAVDTLDTTFDNTCTMRLRVPLDLLPALRGRLADIDGLSFT